MKSILIIGYGKWANKILFFLKKKKLFNKIYIKTRNEIFILQNKNKKKIKVLPHYNNIDLIHVCSPLSTHFNYLKKFLNHRSLIIEKPFLRNLNEFSELKKITNKKKNKIIVNYIDLYNPITDFLKKKIKYKFTKIIFEYSDPNFFFKKEYMCIEDWLEHPLSLTLFLFKKFGKFKVLKKISVKKENKFLEKVEIEFTYKKTLVVIRINLQNRKKRNIYFFKKKKLIFFADLRKNKIIKNQKNIMNKSSVNSIELLYKSGFSTKRVFFQSLDFYKKVLRQRVNIMKSIKKFTNYNKF
jgi:hypothetical protein